MNVNLYLPDELGKRAKKEQLPLSQLLRDAVTEELERRQTVAQTLGKKQEYLLKLMDNDGRAYTGRVTGKQIADSGDLRVFITGDERVLLYNDGSEEYWVIEDPVGELKGSLEPAAYLEAMGALGIKAVIDL